MELSRRELLAFLGVVGAVGAVDIGFPDLVSATDGDGGLLGRRLTPVRLPHDLPVYARKSYLPGVGVGDYSASLTAYTVLDDVVVAPELERYVIVGFGDRVYPNEDDYFGYNCDYTSFRKRPGRDDGWLWVNHEYVSFPMSLGAPGAPAAIAKAPAPKPATSFGPTVGFEIDGGDQLLRWGEFMYVCGGSVVFIRRNRHTDQYAPVSAHPTNRRYHLLSGMAINGERTDTRVDGTPYSALTSWGSLSHQQGDDNYFVGTGPAADEVFPLSSDGLGNRIIGLGYNCSGGFTPWGTILTCEENFQGGGAFFQGCQENVKADGTQTEYIVNATPTVVDDASGATFLNQVTGTFFGQVGEKYGWVVEIDPSDPSWRGRKHTALGRYRHENVALRADKGNALVAYMGDDRRGGHTWKYVSNGTVGRHHDGRHGDDKREAGSALFADGVLHVARFSADGTGHWIPMTLDTPVDPISPSDLASAEAAGRGVAVATITAAKVRLPRRIGIAGQTIEGGPFDATVANEATVLAAYRTLEGTVAQATLADYYTSLGAIKADAFLAAGLAGGTNTARPEDLEINPRRHNEVFIAYTDGAPGGDGYPDSKVFHTGKYTANVDATQQSGGLYKIIEDTHDGTGLTFRWERFKQGGEAGTVEGDGFANVDNLAFDEQGNLWGVTDMGTETHNGLSVTYTGPTLQPGLQTIDHTTTTTAVAANLTGVYGNNWLFVVPMRGRDAGSIIPVAHGAVRCEMTGPTFVDDTLILSVQHPGEDSPVNGDPNAGGDAASVISRSIEVLALDGTTFVQQRTVPRGSNWPSGESGVPPRPSVIGVRRRKY